MQYVWAAPWWPSLLCASMSTLYFHAFCMTRAKNFTFESVTCLYSNPLMCRKRSASCLVFFHLIDTWRCAYRMGLFFASVVGLVIYLQLVVILVISCITVSVLGYGVGSSIMLCCAVLLLVWNAVHHGRWQRASKLWLSCHVVVLPVWTDSHLLCFGLLTSIWR